MNLEINNLNKQKLGWVGKSDTKLQLLESKSYFKGC